MTRLTQFQPFNQLNTNLQTISPICAASWRGDLGSVERDYLDGTLSDWFGSSFGSASEQGMPAGLQQAETCNRRVKDLDNSISIPKVYQIVWPAMQWEHPLRYG